MADALRLKLTIKLWKVFSRKAYSAPLKVSSEDNVETTELRPPCVLQKMNSNGIQGFLQRAREVIYWPGMNKDVEDYVSKCTVCSREPVHQGKEPLICHKLPNRPWEKIAVDLFDLNGTEFVVMVDYYSSFFKVDKLRRS